MNDMLGEMIGVGDRIAVPRRTSTTAYLDVGYITKIDGKRIHFEIERGGRPWRQSNSSYTDLAGTVVVLHDQR